jgi:hypothetical protein
MRSLAGLAALMLFTSCSSLAGDDWIKGRQGELSFAIEWQQAPQSEIVECHYFKSQNEAAVEVDRVRVDFPTGSHHVHIYRSETPADDGVRDCSMGIDWTRWSLMVGVQTQPLDWPLPDGMTIPLAPHQQFLVQVHWLNTTDHPVDRTINLSLHTTNETQGHIGVAFGVAKDVRMDPSQRKTVAGFTPLPAGAHVVAMMGHFHGRGRHYAADLRAFGADMPRAMIYEAADEQTFEFHRYEVEPVAQAGEGVAFFCDYFNDTDVTLSWGPDTKTQEHCNVATYYWPAGDHPSSLYLSGEVARISGAAVAGAQSQLAIELAETAGPAGVDVTLESADGLTVPPMVHVPAWQNRATFAATGSAPMPDATVSATTGAGWTQLPVPVWGLVLSEIYYSPDVPGPRMQWLEIANISAQPIDLSQYSLGDGGSSWADARISLGSRFLPAGGCLVVGGANNPSVPPENPAAGLLVERSDVSLGYGLTIADGVALFGVPPGAPLGPTIKPLDAVIWGGPNLHNLAGSDGLPLAPEKPVSPGQSLERGAQPGWNPQLAPSPGICRLSHAP